MGFENQQGNKPTKKSLGRAALFASVLAFGASEANATEQYAKYTSSKNERISQQATVMPFTGSDLEILREKFPVIDSSVLRWKTSGYVPDAWEDLSDADLSSLITYLSSHRDLKIVNLLMNDRPFGHFLSKHLINLVRKGIMEMIEMYKISDEEASTMTWGDLSLKTIYRIPKDQK